MLISVVMCVSVDAAVEGAHQAIMFNMGQVCCAGSRTYVHESIYDEFVKRSVERAKKRTTGDPFKAENENGPQVTRVVLLDYMLTVLSDLSIVLDPCTGPIFKAQPDPLIFRPVPQATKIY